MDAVVVRVLELKPLWPVDVRLLLPWLVEIILELEVKPLRPVDVRLLLPRLEEVIVET